MTKQKDRKRFRSSVFPHFNNEFLDSICDAFARRGKALRHQGEFTHCADKEAKDWVEFCLFTGISPTIVLGLSKANRFTLEIKSYEKKDRGKIILGIYDELIICTPEKIVRLFEFSSSEAFFLPEYPDTKLKICDKIEREWRKLIPRIV